MEGVMNELEKEYISENSEDESNCRMNTNDEQDNNDTEAEISEETLIAFAREVTKRLEITKRYKYDILKLNLDHRLEMKKNGYCNLM